MAKKAGSAIDLQKNELLNAVMQNLASDPSSPVEGQYYYNTTTDKMRQYQNGAWTDVGAGSGDVSQASNSGGAGRMKVSQGANKVIIDYSGGAGIVKSDANGVVSPASAGTDYAAASHTHASTDITDFAEGVSDQVGSMVTGNTETRITVTYQDSDNTIDFVVDDDLANYSNANTLFMSPSSVATFTNKSFDANGTGNAITNLEVADFAANVVDTDGTFAANSNTRIPSQAAVKTYVDNKVVGLLDYKGAIDASTNPNYPAASKGDLYKISVAGKIGGASGIDVQIGDAIIANADNAGGTQASVGASWDIVQSNTDQATTSALGLVELATQAETKAKTDTLRAVTPASLADFPTKVTATIGDGSTTALVVTDNLGTKDKIANIRDASTDEEIICEVTYGTNTTTFTFATAPATNAYKVVIIG